MKKTLSKIALAVLTVGLLGSCAKINERIDGLEGRIDGIENEQIASINSQITNINSSIADLGQIRSDISSLKQSAENHSVDIFNLEEADRALADRILNLEDYIDGILPKYAETEWVKATFSTLEQYEATCDTIAKIDARIGVLDAKLSKDIQACADSLTKWVNKTFEGYYTAAQMDAKVAQMKTDIDSAKAANKITDAKADSLAGELAKVKPEVDTVKANIRAEYKAAVKSAIEKSEGKLTKALTDAITEVNESITFLFGKVAALETTVATLTGRVDKLEGMIQSVTIVPAYNDGSVEAKDGILYLDIVVEPSEAVVGLTKDSLKVLVNEVKAKTKSVSVDTVAVTNLKVDAVKGTVTARADISTKLPADEKALTIALNVKKGLSDYTTEFYPVTLSKESNVEITAGKDTTKVSIKEDADFPGLVSGTIKVNEGFNENKPTTIMVSGIGTVTFDTKATTQIKSNAAQAGATSVSFKVENVTTTKHVPNADVVLEVTMKTVDETGTEVYCEDKAAGVVTIQIPMAEDVVYVNSVTLVNADGDPIEGGVVPGSKSFEDGILTFKVMHFSEYAIDYVTRGEYKSVTGVSLDLASVSLPVGDSIKLIATIAPENATNKELTWSSSDATKVTVDAEGKVKAVAFGKAHITVTTKDGNETATCEVSVTETKTMSEILGTNTGMPESDNMTPPAKAWVNSTDPTCKAFIGKDGGKKYFVIKKEGSDLAPGMSMDDTFERIDASTYKKAVTGVGTFTVTMAKGKFASYEFAAASGSDYEALNGTYAPATKDYVEIEAKYDGQTVSSLRWYRQSLAITASGKKAWKGGNGSAVKVPGTNDDVVVGDFFPWGTYAGFYGSGAGTDKGLLPYDSFTHKGCGDGSDSFSFKSGKQFDKANAPYYSGSAYTKYNAEDGRTTLEASDDVASIILGGTWRMPTSAEIAAMKAATYWKWDATDKGYYVFIALEGDAGKINDETSNTYEKSDALLFFPAVGAGNGTSFAEVSNQGCYWLKTFSTNNSNDASRLNFKSDEVKTDIFYRSLGFTVRPVQDPEAEYVAATEVKLDITSKEINAKDNVQLKVTVNPSNSTQKGVYWKSSNENVATVDATGKVKGVGEGTATITATTVDGGFTATCTVEVTAKPTFKAVYNTNGDVNTLTFYYDAIDHSGAGITVYENGTANYLFDENKSGSSRWGYYGSINQNIKSVVIDPSVANYSSLTSTAHMFYQMYDANSISGAEYLDVTNVTDMRYMFYGFGYNSTNLTTVPNVSKWNTGNVTTMQEMFSEYGYKSIGLAAVPDVSKWNTGKVTNMSAMFSNYGKNSTGLTAVPNVSKWNTGNVTTMANMFNKYGAQSSNINCVLDLSGWDLAKLSKTAGTIFSSFNPKTFDVTIPAKTGDKANEAGKWYYGDGSSAIEPPTGKSFTLKANNDTEQYKNNDNPSWF